MNIAICDDDSQFLLSFQKMLESCDALPENSVISRFPSGNALVAWYETENTSHFDLVFLDVEMAGLSGLETAQCLRRLHKNMMIVFLTGFKDYVFRSFEIEPFDYIVKPPQESTIRALLRRANKKYSDLHRTIILKWKGETCVLETNDIVYIEGYHRHTTFYTEHDRFSCVGRISEYAKQLSSHGFLRCHQGFLMNIKYIKRINDRSILTTTGVEVEMSVRKRQECLRALNDYLARYVT